MLNIIQIRLPEAGETRIKRVISRSNTKPTGKYPSLKMGHMLHWENIDQLHAFRLLDVTPTISSFHESPMEIQYEIDGEIFFEYPDLLIKSGNLQEIWKIKNLLGTKNIIPAIKEKTFREELLERGFVWRIVDSKRLILEPRKQNIITLLRNGARSVNFIEKERVRNYFERYKTLTWGEVQKGLINSITPQHICRLVIEGYIYFNINQAWTNETIFCWQKPSVDRLEGEEL